MANNKQGKGFYSITLMLIFILLPLVYVTSLVDYTLIPRQLFASIGLGFLLLLLWMGKPKGSVGINALLLSFIGFLIMNFISVNAAINTVESWATISRYLLAFSFLVTLLILLKSGFLNASQIIKAIVLFGAIAAVITLFQLLKALGSGEFLSNIYVVKGTFSHKNLLSSALMLSLPFAIGASISGEGFWKKLAMPLIFLLIIEIFVLRTRGVWVGVFAGALITILVFFWVKRKKLFTVKFPFKLIGAAAAIAVILIVALFSSSGVEDSVSDRTNLDKRMIFWNNSIQMLKDNPVIGVGAGNWKINFPKYGLQDLDYNVVQGITHVQRPHDDFLWVLTESGPIGLLFFIGIFVMAFIYLGRNLKEAESKQELGVDLAILFGLVAYLAFSVTDFPLERTSHNLLLMALLAMIFRKNSSGEKWMVKTNTALPILILATVGSIVVSAYRWQGEKRTTAVLAANAQRNAQRLVPAAEAAINPFYNMDNFANPIRYYSSLGKLVLKDVQGALVDGQEAHDIAPYNIITLVQLGNVYKARKDFDEALKYYNEARRISPSFEIAIFGEAEIYLNRKEYVKAMDALVLVLPNTRDPRFSQQMPYTLQQMLLTREQHGQYKKLMDYLESRHPSSAQDYLQAYRQYWSQLYAKKVQKS